MPRIVTTRAFTLNLEDGFLVNVPAGESEQPEEVATHWFTQAHLVGMPKARMPVVEGVDGLMIEADEAGQRVHEGANLDMGHNASPDLRQEGPISWATRNPAAVDAAKGAAEDAGTEHVEEPTDARTAARQLSRDRRGASRTPAAPPARTTPATTASEFVTPPPPQPNAG